jgi:hypothetical protein
VAGASAFGVAGGPSVTVKSWQNRGAAGGIRPTCDSMRRGDCPTVRRHRDNPGISVSPQLRESLATGRAHRWRRASHRPRIPKGVARGNTRRSRAARRAEAWPPGAAMRGSRSSNRRRRSKRLISKRLMKIAGDKSRCGSTIRRRTSARALGVRITVAGNVDHARYDQLNIYAGHRLPGKLNLLHGGPPDFRSTAEPPRSLDFS